MNANPYLRVPTPTAFQVRLAAEFCRRNVHEATDAQVHLLAQYNAWNTQARFHSSRLLGLKGNDPKREALGIRTQFYETGAKNAWRMFWGSMTEAQVAHRRALLRQR